jgi:hypothetical protein
LDLGGAVTSAANGELTAPRRCRTNCQQSFSGEYRGRGDEPLLWPLVTIPHNPIWVDEIAKDTFEVSLWYETRK